MAHCPQSNCRLGSGIAPAERLAALGGNVSLAVDGAASNEIRRHDQRNEHRLAHPSRRQGRCCPEHRGGRALGQRQRRARSRLRACRRHRARQARGYRRLRAVASSLFRLARPAARPVAAGGSAHLRHLIIGAAWWSTTERSPGSISNSFAMTRRGSWRVWRLDPSDRRHRPMLCTKQKSSAASGTPPCRSTSLTMDQNRSRCWARRSSCSSTVKAIRPRWPTVAAIAPPSCRKAGARMATSRAVIMGGPTTAHGKARADPAIRSRTAASGRAGEGFPLRCALRLRVGGPRGAFASHSGLAAGP